MSDLKNTVTKKSVSDYTEEKIAILIENDRKFRKENNDTMHEAAVSATAWRIKHRGIADLSFLVKRDEAENKEEK